MKGFKALNKDMTCRGYQYEENSEAVFDGEPIICRRGSHFCDNPLDVLDYYDLTESEFVPVEAVGEIKTDDNKKYVTNKIKIGAKLGIKGFVKASVDFLLEKTAQDTVPASGDYSQLAASGDYSKLAASGDSSQLAASGYSSKLAASGDYSKLAASGDYSKLAASGDYSQLAASGYSSKLAASGDYSVAMNAGINGQAKGVVGTWISLAEWQIKENKYVPVCVKSAQIDGVVLKADTYYVLQNGEFTEAK